MNEPYKSIYEALPDSKSLKATKNNSKFVKSTPFDKLKYKELIIKSQTYIKGINSLINKFRNSLAKTNAKKLKIKNTDRFVSWKVSIFPKQIFSSYDHVAIVEFSQSQEKMRDKILSLFIEFNEFIEKNSYLLPEKYKSIIEIAKSEDWDAKGSFAKNSYSLSNLLRNWKEIGITPCTDYEGIKGLYRSHATNAPPACLKGQYTGKIGIGLLMYKAVIHFCGHIYTSSQSDDSKNVWISIKKDSDIISFEYEEHRGMIAISTLLPKDSVIQVLDKYIRETSSFKSFYEWCKTRTDEGDELEEILDNELYALIQNDVDKIKAGVLQSSTPKTSYEYDDDEDYEGDYEDNYYEIIETLPIDEIFYDRFTDRELKDYIISFRNDALDGYIENHREYDSDEEYDEDYYVRMAKQEMLDIKITEYWKDAIGENLYDAYCDYIRRVLGDHDISISRQLEGYGFGESDFKPNGSFYTMIVAKFEYDINRLERPIIENERRDLEREENQKSSSTKSNTSNTVVNNRDEAKQIVDISNLEWKDEESTDRDEIIEMTWDEAFRNTPKGWRLPTIQELHSQIVNSNWGFDSEYYWSSSKKNDNNNVHWVISNNSNSISVFLLGNDLPNSVRYVRDKR
jgi:hypothetical protein